MTEEWEEVDLCDMAERLQFVREYVEKRHGVKAQVVLEVVIEAAARIHPERRRKELIKSLDELLDDRSKTNDR